VITLVVVKAMKIAVALLIVSDRVCAGVMEDRSGPEAEDALRSFADVVDKGCVPDDYAEIRSRLIGWCERGIDVILTIGGTGLSPRDVTPEATRSVIEREVPALSWALLFNGLISTPRAALSRALAGVRGRTLIINLPGSPSAVRSSIEYLQGILPHAVSVIRGAGREEHQAG